jgi:8-oxo-dGTP diphosphatase
MQQPSVSLEVVMLRVFQQQLHVYLNSEMSQKLSLPSIRVDVESDRNIENAVKRGVAQCINGSPRYIEQIKTIGNATRYPEEWMIAVVYMALLPQESGVSSQDWYPVNKIGTQFALAYDHLGVIHSCVKRLRAKAQYTSLPLHLLEHEFTLTEAQQSYEMLLSSQLEKKSFRRRLLDAGILQSLNKERRSHARPAQLYQLISGHIIHHFNRNMLGKNKENAAQ